MASVIAPAPTVKNRQNHRKRIVNAKRVNGKLKIQYQKAKVRKHTLQGRFYFLSLMVVFFTKKGTDATIASAPYVKYRAN